MSHRRIGHGLFLLGAFMLLASVSFLSPASEMYVKAFGTTDIISLTNQARELLGGDELLKGFFSFL